MRVCVYVVRRREDETVLIDVICPIILWRVRECDAIDWIGRSEAIAVFSNAAGFRPRGIFLCDIFDHKNILYFYHFIVFGPNGTVIGIESFRFDGLRVLMQRCGLQLEFI